MSNSWQNIQFKVLKSDSKLNLLIAINVAVFLLINIPAVFAWLFTGSMQTVLFYANEYLAIPAFLPKLALRFWTPLTYMFMHDGIFHILFNMLWLYWLGRIFEEYLGNNRIVGVYLLGGFTGALFFVLSYNFFPVFAAVLPIATTVGASASVMAIVVATATLLPNFSIPIMFIGPVKLKWIAIFYVIFDFLSIAGPNSGGEIAHIGGALMGFIYIKRLQKGSDWIANINNVFKSGPKLSKLKVVARNTNKRTNTRPREDEVDLILDKISKVGYENLSKEEKEVLFRASKNDN